MHIMAKCSYVYSQIRTVCKQYTIQKKIPWFVKWALADKN